VAKNQESYLKHQQVVDQVWAHHRAFSSIVNTLRQYEIRGAEVTPLVRVAVLELESARREAMHAVQQTMLEFETSINDMFNKTLEGITDGSHHPE